MSGTKDELGQLSQPSAPGAEAGETGGTPRQEVTLRALVDPQARAAKGMGLATALGTGLQGDLASQLKEMDSGLQGELAKMLNGVDTGFLAAVNQLQADTSGFAARIAEVQRLEIASPNRINLPDVSRWQELAQNLERSLRPTLRPIDEWLRRPETATALSRHIESFAQTMKAIEERFRMPDFEEVTRLSRAFEASFTSVAEFGARAQREIRAAMEQLHSPWLEISREMQSVQGFVALQDIGAQLTIPASTFHDTISQVLRRQLGDWRDSITLPADIEDVVARSSFYERKGFNPTLTNFPAPAFRESVRIARLNEAPPPPVVPYLPIPAESASEEEGFERTNLAHDWLIRFETHLRRFIDQRMSEVFGPQWIKHQVPGETREEWVEKRRKAEGAGESAPAADCVCGFHGLRAHPCSSGQLEGGLRGRFSPQGSAARIAAAALPDTSLHHACAAHLPG